MLELEPEAAVGLPTIPSLPVDSSVRVCSPTPPPEENGALVAGVGEAGTGPWGGGGCSYARKPEV